MSQVSVLNRKTIFVAGHQGMVGGAILHALAKRGNVDVLTRTRSELDFCNQNQVQEFFKNHQIDEVYLCAAKVGGIQANCEQPADFIYENLMIQANVIHASHAFGVQKLLFLGSSCIYPKLAAQPIAEAALLTGSLEPTNEPYAVAKIAGIKLCESYNRQFGCDFRSVMPTNLFGTGDNFDIQNGHVIPSLLHRFHLAVRQKQPYIDIWGSGQQLREFLFVTDLADACLHVMDLQKGVFEVARNPMQSHVNIGSGQEVTIAQLAREIAKVTGFQGALRFDKSKPDGTPRKLLDNSKISALGWQPKVGLQQGLETAYAWFVANFAALRK